MALDDPWGDRELKERTHDVKTITKAREWWDGCHENDLPVRIKQYETVDGRVRIEIYDKDSKLLHWRG